VKKIIISLSLFLIIIDLSGQWYKKKYNVESIEMLTTEQFTDAEQQSQNVALTGGALVLLGGGSALAGVLYLHRGLGEDPGFLEELIGAAGMGKIMLGLGSVFVATGAITGITGLIRMSSVRSVRNRYNPPQPEYLSQ
jgi:hypothetical protein